jgi:hypothetical protein
LSKPFPWGKKKVKARTICIIELLTDLLLPQEGLCVESDGTLSLVCHWRRKDFLHLIRQWMIWVCLQGAANIIPGYPEKRSWDLQVDICVNKQNNDKMNPNLQVDEIPLKKIRGICFHRLFHSCNLAMKTREVEWWTDGTWEAPSESVIVMWLP